MLKCILNFINLLLVLLLITACGAKNNSGDTGSLIGLQTLVNKQSLMHHHRQSLSKVREMAIRETALSISAQAGLAWRAKIIDQQLTKQARQLDNIFDFNALILEHNILPPVLLEGRNTLNLADTQTIRISDRVYKVAKQARFITTPPNWRQYLWMDYVKPDAPNVSLLPRNKAEQKVWIYYTDKGWRNGIEQADTILEESLARIKEDYTGMIRYRTLLAMNMVSPPYVSNTDLGVTGDGSEIHIDDRVLRITALPALNINSKEWRAAIAKDKPLLQQLKLMEKLVLSTSIMVNKQAWQPVIAPVN